MSDPTRNQSEEQRIVEAYLALPELERQAFLEQSLSVNPELKHGVLESLAARKGREGLTEVEVERLSPANSEKPGQLVGHYRLLELVGQGGMGTVWKAEQTNEVERIVALKLIKAGMDTASLLQRFDRERKVLARLNHPNTAVVYEAGATSQGRPYFSMEYVDGQELIQWAKQRKLDEAGRCRLIIQVCAGVEHAHQKGVIHRDIKPSNILVTDDGIPKLIDFGIAKATSETTGEPSMLTVANQVVGTPQYMSPEQTLGDLTAVDTRSDVYSLGVVFYELLTGQTPLRAKGVSESFVDIQLSLRDEDPPRPSTLAGRTFVPAGEGGLRLSRELDWIVMKAIDIDPARRYASAHHFAADIKRYLGGQAVAAVPPTFGYRLKKFVRQHRTGVLAGVAIFAALTGGLLVSTLALRTEARARVAADLALSLEAKANKETEVALHLAEQARQDATMSLANLLRVAGLYEAESTNHMRAVVLFAEAAIQAAADPEIQLANRIRSLSYRQTLPEVTQAWTTRTVPRTLHFSSNQSGLLTRSQEADCEVFDLASGERWRPEVPFTHGRWSPDGRMISGRFRGQNKVVAFPSGETIRTFPETRGSLSWSPDGAWLAVGGTASAPAVLLHLSSGEQREFGADLFRFRTVEFSPDGEHLLVYTRKQVALLKRTDLSSYVMRPLNILSRPDGVLVCGFCGADGSHFFVNRMGRFQVFLTETGEESHPRRRPGMVEAVSSDGRRLFVQGNHRFYDPVTDTNQRLLAQRLFPSGDWHPSGSVFGLVGKTPEITFGSGFETRSESSPLRPPDLHCLTEENKSIRFSPDGRLLCSAEGQLIRLWDLQPRVDPVFRSISKLKNARVALTADHRHGVAFSGPLVHSPRRSTQIVNMKTGVAVSPLVHPGGPILDAAFGPDAHWCVLAVSDASPNLQSSFDDRLKPVSGRLVFLSTDGRIDAEKTISLSSEPRAVAVHPDGSHIAVLCGNGALFEVDVASASVKTLYPGGRYCPPFHQVANGRCRYSAAGNHIIAYMPNYLHLYDRLAERSLTAPFSMGSTIYAADECSNTVAVAVCDKHNELRFYDLTQGVEARPPIPFENWPLCLRFDASGEHLAVAGRAGKTFVLDWRSGKQVGPPSREDEDVVSVSFLPGRPWLATATTSSRLRFIEPRTGQPLHPAFERSFSNISQLTPSIGGRELMLGSMDRDGQLVLDLEHCLPTPRENPEIERLRAELNSGLRVHGSGELVALSKDEWLSRWAALQVQVNAQPSIGN